MVSAIYAVVISELNSERLGSIDNHKKPKAKPSRPTRQEWKAFAKLQYDRVCAVDADLLRHAGLTAEQGSRPIDPDDRRLIPLMIIPGDTQPSLSPYVPYAAQSYVRPSGTSLKKVVKQGTSGMLFLVGEDGAGKTVELCRVVKLQVRRGLYWWRFRRPRIPVYVSLADLAFPGERPTADDILEHVLLKMTAHGELDGYPQSDLPQRCFDWGQKNGKLLLLIDDFDKIPALLDCQCSSTRVRQYVSALSYFATTCADCRVVVASRPSQHLRLYNHPQWKVDRLSPTQQRKLLRSWFRDRDDIEAVYAELCKRERNLGRYAGNPLDFSLVASARKRSADRTPDSLRDALSIFAKARLSHVADTSPSNWTSTELACGRLALQILTDKGRCISRTYPQLIEAVPEAHRSSASESEDAITILVKARLLRVHDGLDATHPRRLSFRHPRILTHFAILGLEHRTAPLPLVRGRPFHDPVSLQELMESETWLDVAVGLLEPPHQSVKDLGICAAQLKDAIAKRIQGFANLVAVYTSAPNPSLRASIKSGGPGPYHELYEDAFSWSIALHLIRIVHRAAERGAAFDAIVGAAVDRLLVTAYSTGSTRLKHEALSLVRAASKDGQIRLLSAGFRSPGWRFMRVCLDQSLKLPELPEPLTPKVRKALVAQWSLDARSVTGDADMKERLKYLDPSGSLHDSFRVLCAIGPVDRWVYSSIAAYLVVVAAFQLWLPPSHETSRAETMCGVAALLFAWLLLFSGRVGEPRRVDGFLCQTRTSTGCLWHTWMSARLPSRLVFLGLSFAIFHIMSSRMPIDIFVGQWWTMIEARTLIIAFVPAIVLAAVGALWALFAPLAAMSNRAVEYRAWLFLPYLVTLLVIPHRRGFRGTLAARLVRRWRNRLKVRQRAFWLLKLLLDITNRLAPSLIVLGLFAFLVSPWFRIDAAFFTAPVSSGLLYSCGLPVSIRGTPDFNAWLNPYVLTVILVAVLLALVRLPGALRVLSLVGGPGCIQVKDLIEACSLQPRVVGEQRRYWLMNYVIRRRGVCVNKAGLRYLKEVIEAIERDARSHSGDNAASSLSWQRDVQHWYQVQRRRSGNVAYLSRGFLHALVELRDQLEQELADNA